MSTHLNSLIVDAALKYLGQPYETLSPEFSAVSVSGPIEFAPEASATPTANGDLVFEATSNTALTIKYKGSDGTVRSVELTLS